MVSAQHLKGSYLTSAQAEGAKWIAVASMAIDHTERLLWHTGLLPIELLGRIAFPVFAFLIAHNFLYFTSNKKMYVARLSVFSLISQPFYAMALQTQLPLNIFFTLALGAASLYLFEEMEKRSSGATLYTAYSLFLIFIAAPISTAVSYGIPGVFLVISSYFFMRKMSSGAFSHVFAALSNLYSITAGIFSAAVILLLHSKLVPPIKTRMNKWFFYIFYPGHLFLLALLS